MTPDCDKTGRCWKRVQLSNGFYIRALAFSYVSLGHSKASYSLTLGQPIATLSEFKKLTFPLRVKIADKADQDLLIQTLEGVRFGVDLLSNRFRVYCNDGGPVEACYLDVSDLNYASVSRGKKGVDLESVSRGTSYSTHFMPDWNVQILGPAADGLYDAMFADGGKHLTKRAELTPTISLECQKRPKASDPYTACGLSVSDKSRGGFKHPERVTTTFVNTSPHFPSAFTYASKYGLFAIECPSKSAADSCDLRVQ